MPLTPTEKTILVVDDDALVRQYVIKVLAGEGYQVYDAHGGVPGFSCFLEHADEIDLVFTDVVMPELSGPEMVDRILRHRPKVKILFMTGYSSADTAKAHPHCGVLHKPFTKTAMLSCVQECLRNTAQP
ncbi:MAG: response regulator [Acidobacteriia bacterium]|nr:response regulator [Terriglobia bacterium]